MHSTALGKPTVCCTWQRSVLATARAVLGMYGLPSAQHLLKMAELSGGQKARVALAVRHSALHFPGLINQWVQTLLASNPICVYRMHIVAVASVWSCRVRVGPILAMKFDSFIPCGLLRSFTVTLTKRT
eukprot:SAG11_NODE_574_length_8430_cov_11.461769_12_plen_129_part_00